VAAMTDDVVGGSEDAIGEPAVARELPDVFACGKAFATLPPATHFFALCESKGGRVR
jgi:hypothetical protein